MRIWHQSFTDLTALPIYARRLSAHARQVVGTGIIVDVYGMPTTAPAPAERYPYVEYLLHKSILDAVSDAERGGYDAVALGCFYDPALREARSLVDIPVLGMAETSMLLGCFHARRLGFITLSRPEAEAVRDLVETYGLSSRLAASV